MKKRLVMVLLIMSMTVLLSGCFKMEAGININSDNFGEVYSKILVTDKFEGDANNEDLFDFSEGATKEYIEEIHNNEKYTGELQKQPFNSLNELKKLFNDDQLQIKVNGDIVTLLIESDPAEETQEDIETKAMLKMAGITTDFKITAPEIIETNGKIDGNTASWDFMDMNENIYLKYRIGKATSVPTPPIVKQIKVTLNGKELIFPDQLPVVINDRTLVPIRTISEELGMEVVWDNDTRSAKFSKDNKSIHVVVGEKEILVYDGLGIEKIELEVPAQIINSRTMVPLRAISEIFGIQVNWDADNYTAVLVE